MPRPSVESWKQQDFQHLAAFYGQTQRSLHGIRDVGWAYRVENRRTGQIEMIACEVPFGDDLLPSTGSPRTSARRPGHAPRKPGFRATPRSTRHGRCCLAALLSNRSTVCRPAARIRPRLDILADDFVAHGYDLRRLLETIAASKPFRLDSKTVDAAPGGCRQPGAAGSHLGRIPADPITGGTDRRALLHPPRCRRSTPARIF